MSARKPVPVAPLLGDIGAIMVIVSLFLDWYDGVTGFTVFEALDLVLVALALTVIVSLAGGFGRWPQTEVNPGRSVAAAIAVLLIVASQLLNDPPAVVGSGGPGHAVGIWLALGGAVLMLAGALAAVTHVSFDVDLSRKRAPAKPAASAADADAPTAVERTRPEDA